LLVALPRYPVIHIFGDFFRFLWFISFSMHS
jgi:hypothetical protein